MDDEIEDMVGDVKYTDSQKSVTTFSSVAYSLDFTDAGDRCSEKNLSSGKQTYVIECDSDSDNMLPLKDCESKMLEPLYGPSDCPLAESSSPVSSAKCGPSYYSITKYASTSYHYPLCPPDAQETFTQTSKTLIELAETERRVNNIVDSKNLQTQTSYMSFTENRTVEYRIQVTNFPMKDHLTVDELFIENYATSNISDHIIDPLQSITYDETSVEEVDDILTPEDVLPSCFGKHQISFEFENESSNFPVSETDVDNEVVIRTFSNPSITSVESQPELKVEDNKQATESHEGVKDEENEKQVCKEICDGDSDHTPSDIEEDSLMRDLPIKSADVKESGDIKIEVNQSPRVLTPLTEETGRKLSWSDVRPAEAETSENIVPLINDELLFTNETGFKVKLLNPVVYDAFRLPPIHKSCPTSPHMHQLGNPKFNKAGTLPSLYESQNRWELSTKTLASGESAQIRGRSGTRTRRSQPKLQLPPISTVSPERRIGLPEVLSSVTLADTQRIPSISIKEKIKELKMTKPPWSIKRNSTRSHSENQSPCSSPERVEIANIAHLGCEAICIELLKRLREGSWYQVVETLEELPSALEKFWKNISEMRIADLLRQVNIHVESPRPQVARTACTTVAAILKNTKYTKKPDFYETISLLLTKTGSYSRLVRRSANLALDNIVCAVEMTQAITALCMHGVEHKNGLVRCAAARLLVVSCALGGAGRKLLRARPPTAATARRHALRALAVLLDDKSTETRKYAERLYLMLRQLSSFEAYYLTDVAVDTATRQMKKYDLLLPPKDAR